MRAILSLTSLVQSLARWKETIYGLSLRTASVGIPAAIDTVHSSQHPTVLFHHLASRVTAHRMKYSLCDIQSNRRNLLLSF